MYSSLVSTSSISFLLVLFEGFLSFFSPCVVPLIPIYMSYLTGNADTGQNEGKLIYNRKKVLLNTVFFVLGISFAFFILGLSFTFLGRFFQSKRLLFSRLAGVIIIMLGLFQLGILDFKILNTEKKAYLNLNKKAINPLTAILLGFTFSFAWTPCVGPALSSVLVLASTASSSLIGNALVLIYTLGFTVPFLFLGLCTTQALNFLRKNQNLIKYTVKVGGMILIMMGVMTFTGWMNNISGYLNSLSSTNLSDLTDSKPKQEKPTANENQQQSAEEKNSGSNTIPAFDFTLTDQYGDKHTLSDYKGKVVFLNFWATWCPPCRKEMPDIQKLYEEYNFNQNDVVFLGVASPRSEKNKNTREIDKDGIKDFLEKNCYTFPVVFDETGEVFKQYGISALPTTFLISKNGNIYGYAPGMLTKEIMENIVKETLNSTD